ncbi:MAG TPA: FAD-dependent oxidoreductase [Trueperaceae bacterium]
MAKGAAAAAAVVRRSAGDTAAEAAHRHEHRERLPVLIVGGGIAGCSLAYALAKRGIEALLLDQGALGSQGASAVAAALLNPYRGRSGKPGPFDLEGLEAVRRISDDLQREGLEAGVHRTGVLRIAADGRQVRSWSKLPGMRRVTRVPSPYRAPHGAFLVEEGGWVEPARLVAALVASAREKGARFIENVRVLRVESVGGEWQAHSAGGARFSAGALVLCLGAGRVAGVQLPHVEFIAGDQVTLVSETDLPYPIAGSVYLTAQRGRVFVGGNHRSPGTDDPQAPQLLRSAAARMVPALAESAVERVWTGVRAKRSDNVPVMEELRPGLWYLGAFGGRGFLTAPLLAERLAERLKGGGA